VINEIARMFNGGGHKNASGVKNMTLDEVYDLIALLKKAIRKTLG
jgi:nanoRNase/pAp phosphatase (c-di-AMP/oligoRNAs hydrolase)